MCNRVYKLGVLFFVVFFIFGLYFNVYADVNDDLDWEIVEASSNFSASEANPPLLSCPSAVVIDTVNQRILFGKNAFAKRQMASTAKMMTAILAIERGKLSDKVVVSKKASNVGGSKAGLKANETIQIDNLLYALMLPSGNDAAIALAEHIGGSVDNFVGMMNEKAAEIGAKDTKYASPHGLDNSNTTTAYDLAVIAGYCLKNPVFAKVVRTNWKTIPREKMTNGSNYQNTNDMLDTYQGADGIKTGFTNGAGRCLVTSATRGGWQVVSVVLGALTMNARSSDSKKMLDYAFENYPEQTVLPKDQKVQNIAIKKGVQDTVQIANQQEISLHIKDSEFVQLDREFNVPQYLNAPVGKGVLIGEMKLRLGNIVIGTSNLYTAEQVASLTYPMVFHRIIIKWLEIPSEIEFLCKGFHL